jgi:hypothetical protein
MARTDIWVEGQDASDGSQGSKNRSTSCEVICEKRALGKNAPLKHPVVEQCGSPPLTHMSQKPGDHLVVLLYDQVSASGKWLIQ